MKNNSDKQYSGGFYYWYPTKMLREYMAEPVLNKLLWLEEANHFCQKFIKGKRRKIWEKIRRGEF